MIPQADIPYGAAVVRRRQPTHTYRMDLGKEKVSGYTDGLKAMEQAVYKILGTERYRYIIYSWNYGVELADLFGEPIPYVYPELQRRITEALLWDDRITAVTDFKFSHNKGDVLAEFTVHTIFGDFPADRSVTIA